MFGSRKLGKLFGIDLFVHGTFWLLPLFVFFSGALAGDAAGAAFDVAVLLAVFGCVALHEVGHALAARFYGIPTRDITLYPVGGVARLDRMPERPWQEIVIALAGPAVNLMIAVGLVAGVVAGNTAFPGAFTSLAVEPAGVFVERLLMANVALLLFNLLPAFPMDGGRVLRAVLSLGMRRVDATLIAVRVGAVMAAAFLFVGLFGFEPLGISPGNFSLMLVAAVVYLLGRGELAAVRHQEARRRAEWDGGDYETAGEVHPRAGRPPFSGWAFDPTRRVWGLWRDGILLREVPSA